MKLPEKQDHKEQFSETRNWDFKEQFSETRNAYFEDL
jgi:hypothetical protein